MLMTLRAHQPERRREAAERGLLARQKHMAVVSSIHYADVKNVYNDGAQPMTQLSANTRGDVGRDARTAAATLRAMNPLAERLTGRSRRNVAVALAGHCASVASRSSWTWGHSRFRCPLPYGARRRAYRVAVFIRRRGAVTGGRHPWSARCSAPACSASSGWRVCTVLAKDWLDDARPVVRRVETRLDSETAVEESRRRKSLGSTPPVRGSAPEGPAPPVPTAAPAPPAARPAFERAAPGSGRAASSSWVAAPASSGT
jgi:hypothetical protein